MERPLTVAASDLHWARPAAARGTGVLVLAGSSGRVDVGRAELLASYGVTARALRWFGGEGQPPVPREVPLETFAEALDLLLAECDRVVLMGLSYGAEAALLTACVDPRVDAVVALAPTDVAWEGQAEHDDDRPRSKWTWAGRPLPFVPLDRAWQSRAVTTGCGPAARRPSGSRSVVRRAVCGRWWSSTRRPVIPWCCRGRARRTCAVRTTSAGTRAPRNAWDRSRGRRSSGCCGSTRGVWMSACIRTCVRL
ncbi:hypothetical protein [Nocardioides lijunqiniae]|uniref:hypothetical protein n=1 Tax=Nocardioides lijunqiniae TaxID=2760832 RepID=UPI0022278A14|nr:hypothetical protein [Nocardioides lijunqiniae]